MRRRAGASAQTGPASRPGASTAAPTCSSGAPRRWRRPYSSGAKPTGSTGSRSRRTAPTRCASAARSCRCCPAEGHPVRSHGAACTGAGPGRTGRCDPRRSSRRCRWRAWSRGARACGTFPRSRGAQPIPAVRHTWASTFVTTAKVPAPAEAQSRSQPRRLLRLSCFPFSLRLPLRLRWCGAQ